MTRHVLVGSPRLIILHEYKIFTPAIFIAVQLRAYFAIPVIKQSNRVAKQLFMLLSCRICVMCNGKSYVPVSTLSFDQSSDIMLQHACTCIFTDLVGC